MMRELQNIETKQVSGSLVLEVAAFGAFSGFGAGLGFAALFNASGEVLTNSLIIVGWTIMGATLGVL
ncbi:MAG: hypothetical protein J0H47_08180 [Gammaproteobacteria bacterium]|nr:hypothetical protein [Gammaproteobacteria bacterium]